MRGAEEDRDLEACFRAVSANSSGQVDELRRALLKERLFSPTPAGVRAGRFVVLRQLGGGGMGAVYEARDTLLDRRIALKLMRAENESARDEITREARALAKLNHPHVVAVHEIGEHDERLFLVMELIEGRNLEDWSKDQVRSWQETLAYYLDAARGLSAAHAAGVVHRDFKASNVMVGTDGRARVVDFGLAGEREKDELAADQASFARALHAALFEPPLPGCPKILREILRRGFHAQPSQRWASLAELSAALDRGARRGTRILIAGLASAVAALVLTSLAAALLFFSPTASQRTLTFDIPLGDGPSVPPRSPVEEYKLLPDQRVIRRASNGEETHILSLPGLEISVPRGWRFSDRANYLASFDFQGRAALVDLRSAPHPTKYFDIATRVPAASFSGNEEKVVFWSRSSRFSLVDTLGRIEPKYFDNPEGEIRSLAIDHSGTRLLTGPTSGPARLWYLDEDPPRSVPLGHGGGIATIEFSPDGSRAATASDDRTIRVWELRSHAYAQLSGRHQLLRRLYFSNDGNQLMVLTTDAFRTYTISDPRSLVYAGHQGKIWSAALSHDRTRLATAGFDSTARIWDLEGRRPAIVLHHDGSDVYSAVFSSDDRFLATAGNDGTARLWDSTSGELLRVFSGHAVWAYGLAFSPDGRWLATGDKSGALRVWSLESAAPARVLDPGCPSRMQRLDLIKFSSDGRRLAAQACGCGGGTCVFRTDNFQEENRADNIPSLDARDLISLGGDRWAIPRGHGALQSWRSSQNLFEPEYDPPAGRIFALELSPDGNYLATGSSGGGIQLFRTGAPRPISTLRAHDDWIVDLAFDSHGRRLASASYDGTVRIFQVDGLDDPLVLRGHNDKVRFVAFTGEKRVVSASFDGTVRMWKIDE